MIEGEDELGLMRRIIDKVHRMVALRTQEEFDEGEQSLLRQLFGDYQNKPVTVCAADADLLQMLDLQSTIIEQ